MSVVLQFLADWRKDLAIGGIAGVLGVVGLWEPLVEMTDRWEEGGSVVSAVTLTAFLAIVVLVVVLQRVLKK